MDALNVDDPTVSLEVAQHVLWHWGDTNLGLQPGSFTSSLLQTIDRADPQNLARLRLGFPEEVFALTSLRRELWGEEWLRSRVKRALVPDGALDLVEGAHS